LCKHPKIEHNEENADDASHRSVKKKKRERGRKEGGKERKKGWMRMRGRKGGVE
jgi:hypothetical protein